MPESQMMWLIGGVAVVIVAILLSAITRLESRLARVERQNDRQLDMLIPLLQRNGIDPVTLD